MTATTPQRFPLLTAGFFGLTGVILGALGAHRLQPLLAAVAENAELLVNGDDATFMNRIHLATAGGAPRMRADLLWPPCRAGNIHQQ